MGSSSRAITRNRMRAFRQEATRKPLCPAIVDEALIQAIDLHILLHIGVPAMVIHEPESTFVHVDVHVARPTAACNWFTLVTSGMAALAMTRRCPHDTIDRYAELVMRLPRSWPLQMECGVPLPQDPRVCWPFTWLADLAQMPQEQDTYFDALHTTQHFDPLPGTRFVGSLLMPAIHPAGLEHMTMSATKTVQFLEIWPLYDEEIRYKLNC